MENCVVKSELSEVNPRRSRHASFSSDSSRSRSRSRDRHSRKYSKRRTRYSRSRSRKQTRSYTRSPSYHRRVRYHGTRENPHKSRVIGIFGLNPVTNEAQLMDVFSPFGTIEHVSIIHDAKTGNSRGFGFVYYAQIDQATRARSECNGMTLDGKRIRVDYSITKRAHTPTPGVYMGDREGSCSRHSKSISKCCRPSWSHSKHRRRSRSHSDRRRRSGSHSGHRRRSRSHSGQRRRSRSHSGHRRRSRSHSGHRRGRRYYELDYSRSRSRNRRS